MATVRLWQIIALLLAVTGLLLGAATHRYFFHGTLEWTPGRSSVWEFMILAGIAGFSLATVFYFLHRTVGNLSAANASLTDSEQRFRDFADTASDWYWETDAEDRFTGFWGRMVSDEQGHQSALIGKTRRELVQPEFRDAAFEQCAAAIRARVPFQNIVLTRRSRSGVVRHLRVSGKPIFSGNGEFLGYRGATSEVTEQVRTERARAELQRLLDGALEALSDAIFITDPDDRILRFNEKAKAFLSDGKTFFGVGTPFEDIARARAEAGVIAGVRGREDEWLAERLSARADPNGRDLVFRLADGRWLRTSERVMADGGHVTIVSDITDLKRVEEEVRRSRETLSQALDSISDGFLLWDEEDRCVLWNRRCVELSPEFVAELAAGKSFEASLRDWAAKDGRRGLEGDPEEWIAARLARRRNGSGSFECEVAPGRWLRITESATESGGTVAVWTDISDLKRNMQTAAEKTALLEATLANLQPGVCAFDADFRLTAWNRRFLEILEFPAEFGMVGTSYETFARYSIARQEYGDCEPDAKVAEMLAEVREHPRVRFERRRPNGVVLDVERSPMPTGGFVTTFTDVTRHKEIEAALRRREEQLEEIVETAPVPVVVIATEDRRIHFANTYAAELFGAERAAIVGRLTDELLWARDEMDAIQAELAENHGRIRGRAIRIRRHDGAMRWVEVSAQPGSFDGAQSVIATFMDVTERREAEAHIRELAFVDPLTKLPNRRLFQDHLERTLAQAERDSRLFAVHYVDLDDFKQTNDTLGHEAGDALLKQVARRLQDCVRDADMLARLGGDEFAVIQTGIARTEDAARLAERIVDALARPFRLGADGAHTGASVGITVFPDDAAQASELLRNADLALYRAKGAGRNTYAFYSQGLGEEVKRRVAVINALRKAVAFEQFVLHYQPICDLATGAAVRFEALLRWHDPKRGLVTPADFLPVAEASGLIVPIGRWVLREVCAQLRQWATAGLPLKPVTVNVSTREMRERDFIAATTAALRDADLSPGLIHFEVTEGILAEDIDRAIEVSAELEQLGIVFAIDDFGVGHSSLSAIKRMPVSVLKIDRSFVEGIGADSDDTGIVKAVIALARTLGLTAVAEGVETEEQRDFLLANGCHEAQGYLFCRPLPPEDAAAKLLAPRPQPATASNA